MLLELNNNNKSHSLINRKNKYYYDKEYLKTKQSFYLCPILLA